MNPQPLFPPGEMMQFQALTRQAMKQAALVPLALVWMALQALVLSGVFLLEWEIIYQVFDYLAGEGAPGEAGGYWQPGLMAISALSMIVAYHLLAKVKPESPAVRFVEGAVQWLIPTYLVGIGLLIASILYADGLGGMAQSAELLSFGALSEPAGPGWLERLFTHVTDPLATLVLSLGLGGLAVINIFVAHALLDRLSHHGADSYARLRQVRSALQDHAEIKRCQKAHGDLGVQIEALAQQGEVDLRLQLAAEVIPLIGEALLPHKTWLTERTLAQPSRFEAEDDVDPKQIEARIKQLEAITYKDVLQALTPLSLEKRS